MECREEQSENEHPLEFSFCLSYFKRPPGKFNPEEYSYHVQNVATFGTVRTVVQFVLKQSIDIVHCSLALSGRLCFRWSSSGGSIRI